MSMDHISNREKSSIVISTTKCGKRYVRMPD
jgi:hypothetical protein